MQEPSNPCRERQNIFDLRTRIKISRKIRKFEGIRNTMVVTKSETDWSISANHFDTSCGRESITEKNGPERHIVLIYLG